MNEPFGTHRRHAWLRVAAMAAIIALMGLGQPASGVAMEGCEDEYIGCATQEACDQWEEAGECGFPWCEGTYECRSVGWCSGGLQGLYCHDSGPS